jgi:aminoglycoside phosphotransferase (APT) family kinase protein
VLLHRDLHPQNVLLTGNGPMIIDWEGAVACLAVADVTMTWVIIRFSQVPGSRIQAACWRPVQAVLAREFTRAAGPIDEAWRATAIPATGWPTRTCCPQKRHAWPVSLR